MVAARVRLSDELARKLVVILEFSLLHISIAEGP